MTTTDVLDALADVYDALGPVTRDDLTALAADPKLLVHVAKTAEKGIRDSCPEKHLPYLETEAAQRAYKALVEGSFKTSRDERRGGCSECDSEFGHTATCPKANPGPFRRSKIKL